MGKKRGTKEDCHKIIITCVVKDMGKTEGEDIIARERRRTKIMVSKKKRSKWYRVLKKERCELGAGRKEFRYEREKESKVMKD